MPDGIIYSLTSKNIIKNKEECAVVYEGLDYLINNYKPKDTREERAITTARQLRARFSNCKGEF